MTSSIGENNIHYLSDIIRKFRQTLAVRFERQSIVTVDNLVEFIQTRAVYVAQTSLYGYLKTRMGTRYREIFQDDKFVGSIDLAKWQVCASCLADLTIFAVAHAGAGGALRDSQSASMARYCFENSVRQAFTECQDESLIAGFFSEFEVQILRTQWDQAAEGENAFHKSPRDLIKWAPIADELKALDEEIVVNSTRFRWRDVRAQLRKRLDGPTVCGNWLDNFAPELDQSTPGNAG